MSGFFAHADVVKLGEMLARAGWSARRVAWTVGLLAFLGVLIRVAWGATKVFAKLVLGVRI